MSKFIIENDRSKQWRINESHEEWLLDTDATLTVAGKAAIRVMADSIDNIVRLRGDIVSTGSDSLGIRMSGDDNRLRLYQSSTVTADDGIAISGDDNRIRVDGDIGSEVHGIRATGSFELTGHGEITGLRGIGIYGGSASIVNGENGYIAGGAQGIYASSEADQAIANHGVIDGGEAAVMLIGGGDDTIVNKGSILGHVLLGNGDDTFDTRGGKATGEVSGGDGNDIYRIGNKEVDIVEQAGEGYDRVYAARSHSMQDNVEFLQLTGKKDASAFAHDGGVTIRGNAGENTIAGGNGDDFLDGGAGDDIYNGDDGDDMFYYAENCDRDRITGFAHGDDTIWLFNIDGVQDFDDLEDRMIQHGVDVRINLGNGDRVTVMDTDLGDMDAGDFSFDTISSM